MRLKKCIVKKDIKSIIEHPALTTKISLYFGYTTYGDDYDQYEKNTIDAKLNPKIIKAYVRDISPEALVYKQYGLHEQGAKEIICDARFKGWFEKCAKITINSKEYQVFKEGAGQRAIITERPFDMIRVVLSRRTQ